MNGKEWLALAVKWRNRMWDFLKSDPLGALILVGCTAFLCWFLFP